MFTKRNDLSLTEHSGIICLDFDSYEKQRDLLQDKENLSKDKFVFSVFISPSGNGLKVLVKIPPVSNDLDYKSFYSELQKHYDTNHMIH